MKKFDKKLKRAAEIFLEMAYGADPNAQAITKEELIEKIKNIENPDTLIKFTSIITAAARKKNRETGDKIQQLYKVSQVVALMNVDYRARMTAAGRETGELGAEQEHELGRTYGQHETATIIEHQGKTYLQVMPQSALPPQFVIQKIAGFQAVTRQEATPYLPDPRPAPEGAAGQNPIRRYSIDSIVAIEINGQDFKISDIMPDRRAVLNLVNINPERAV